MNNLNRLLKQPLRTVPVKTAVVALVVALIGFADAVYLTLEHYRGVVPPCTIAGCEVVLTSPYSILFGIPVSLLGVVYYLAVLVGLFVYIESRNLTVLKWTLAFTVFGLISSAWFTYVQAAIIGAYCQYCLLSALTSVILFVIGFSVLLKYTASDTLPE